MNTKHVKPTEKETPAKEQFEEIKKNIISSIEKIPYEDFTKASREYLALFDEIEKHLNEDPYGPLGVVYTRKFFDVRFPEIGFFNDILPGNLFFRSAMDFSDATAIFDWLNRAIKPNDEKKSHSPKSDTHEKKDVKKVIDANYELITKIKDAVNNKENPDGENAQNCIKFMFDNCFLNDMEGLTESIKEDLFNYGNIKITLMKCTKDSSEQELSEDELKWVEAAVDHFLVQRREKKTNENS